MERVLFLTIAMVLVILGSLSAQADWRDDIGWTKLLTEKGVALENGAGVNIAMSEAFVGSNYLPDLASSQFTGKTFTNGSGIASGISGHANSVATNFYGNTGSIANGISNITLYQADDWINNRLNFVSGADPVAQDFKVLNHSWIGNNANDAAMQNIVMRADYIVNRDNITIVAGTNNANGAIPDLLAHSFNVITVGLTNGNHAYGPTRFYQAGRYKPDIVAPASATSFATPIVSAAAAILYQKGAGTDATNNQVIRAVLLAGATKEEFASTPNVWDQTANRRLDDQFGAGELNIYNSYHILEGGQFDGSIGPSINHIGDHGWDYKNSIAPASSVSYNIDIADGFQWRDFSVILAWNINVIDLDASAAVFNPSAILADMNLDLLDASGTILFTSSSTLGNVEHLYLSSLLSGRYTMRVTSNFNTDFGIAWRGTVAKSEKYAGSDVPHKDGPLTAVPEPTSVLLQLLVAIGFHFVRRRINQ